MSKKAEIAKVLEKALYPLTTREIQSELPVNWSTDSVRHHLKEMEKTNLVRGAWRNNRLTWESDSPEKRAYRERKETAQKVVALKRELGVKMYELLIRSLATVKTPGLRADIEEIKRRVEECSAPKS